jgi:hypothetical protein
MEALRWACICFSESSRSCDEQLVQFTPIQPDALAGGADVDVDAFARDFLHLGIVVRAQEKRQEFLLENTLWQQVGCGAGYTSFVRDRRMISALSELRPICREITHVSLNYRHAFHAGNFADVVKHVALALCFDRLNTKPAPYRYIDTHAGIGAL